MKFFNNLRTKQILTFPVETMAMVYDPKTNDIIDKDYKDFTAEMYAEGHSFFTYISDSADSLASCCRLRNELAENTFNPTSGLTGVMTGSCNVITLNINRIVQDCAERHNYLMGMSKIKAAGTISTKGRLYDWIKEDLRTILERVYKYHIAYKTMMYDLEDCGMITYSNANYLYMKKLYSTIGVLGYYEAAKFLGLKDGTDDYNEFMQLVLGTIAEENKKHSIHDKKRPFVFNQECIPGEGLAVKLYNWDKENGYFVPSDQNLYNSYFFNPWKETSPLKKLEAHGSTVSKASDGGQGCHINLDTHLSSKQYLMLMEHARNVGCNYFTFNIPMTKCLDCNHVVNAPVTECPKCHSHKLDYYTRIIGFLTSVSN